MCGIAGMIDWRAATSAEALRTIAVDMTETLRHRGPDAGDVWVEASGGAALGQRRLAIIDLSPGGAQPMHSADRRYVIVFNGEIYNYTDIRQELAAAGRRMRSDSDTEVLLEACALWGVEAAIERTVGMFAFALWDRAARTLVLARDRLGIKPLYYAAMPDRVLFASQLKAFRQVPDWKPTIDADSVVGLPPSRLYRPAAHDLSRGGETCSWSYPDARGRPAAATEMLLGHARHRDGGRSPKRSEPGRGRSGRAARRAAAGFGQAPDDRGCTAGRLSVRRHRLFDRRRPDAGAEHASGQDVLHRLP